MEIVFTKQDANRNAMKVQTLLLTKPVKKFASDKDEGVFLVGFYEGCSVVFL